MTNNVLQVAINNPIPQPALSFPDFLPSLVSAIVGALVGAGTAYMLYCAQRKRDARKACQAQLNKKYDAGNKALFALFCQTLETVDLKKLIAPYEKDPERSKNLPVFERDYSSTPKIDLNSLSFLLDADMCPNLLSELYLAQQSFEKTTSMFASREFVRSEITHQEMAGTISDFTKKQLGTYTDALFTRVDLTHGKLSKIQEPLVECLEKIGHGMKPITFEMIDD